MLSTMKYRKCSVLSKIAFNSLNVLNFTSIYGCIHIFTCVMISNKTRFSKIFYYVTCSQLFFIVIKKKHLKGLHNMITEM